jgi:hypothetical protein
MLKLKISVAVLALPVLTAVTIAIANPSGQNGQQDPTQCECRDHGPKQSVATRGPSLHRLLPSSSRFDGRTHQDPAVARRAVPV